MKKLSVGSPPKRQVLILTFLVVMTAGAGVASAAVSASFSASYDGWADDTSSDYPGHEIQVSGSVSVSGDNAVDPRIVIMSGESTVLDTTSVTLLQEESAINFNKRYASGRVIYTTEEIPSGTELQIEFVVYYVGGSSNSELTVGRVNAFWNTPEGESEQQRFEVTSTLENRPDDVISRLQEERGDLQAEVDELESRVTSLSGDHPLPAPPGERYLAYLAFLLLIGIGLYIAVRSRSENGGPPQP